MYEKMKLKVSVKNALTEKQKTDDAESEEAEPEKTGDADSLLPSLRKFREGRYEEVLRDFEKRQARKAGVAVEEPDPIKKKRRERRKLRKAVRHMEKRGVFEQ